MLNYIIVVAGTTQKLMSIVNEKLSEGYRPVGGHVWANKNQTFNPYEQAMIYSPTPQPTQPQNSISSPEEEEGGG